MARINEKLLDEVAGYYSKKIAQYGNTPLGVDWNGEASQILRFQQLSKVITADANFSLNDLGSGYGALFEFLLGKYKAFSYLGIDISLDMVKAAINRYGQYSQSRFINSKEPDGVADFSIASGIFNVRLGYQDDEWYTYLEDTLDILDRTSRQGFSFNCLTSYSDEDKKRDYLYYADPCVIFDLCKRRYSRNVALLHDYGLYEFTILVRKIS